MHSNISRALGVTKVATAAERSWVHRLVQAQQQHVEAAGQHQHPAAEPSNHQQHSPLAPSRHAAHDLGPSWPSWPLLRLPALIGPIYVPQQHRRSNDSMWQQIQQLKQHMRHAAAPRTLTSKSLAKSYSIYAACVALLVTLRSAAKVQWCSSQPQPHQSRRKHDQQVRSHYKQGCPCRCGTSSNPNLPQALTGLVTNDTVHASLPSRQSAQGQRVVNARSTHGQLAHHTLQTSSPEPTRA